MSEPSPPRRLRRRHPLHEWRPVTTGLSGAGVWRLARRRSVLFAKTDTDHAALAAEAERCIWLAATGIGAPEVVDLDTREPTGWLVTTAVPGRTLAEDWPRHQRAPLVAALARLTRRLHDLDPADCPFDARLPVMLRRARDRVAAGAVDEDDFDAQRRGRSARELLAELESTVPRRQDLVVTHGDLCLPNVLVDPATLEPTGVVDVGRLGVADRHQDLALAVRSLADHELNPDYGDGFARAFTEHYGPHHADPARIAFYQLLDEFF